MTQPERSEDHQLVIPAWSLLLPIEWDTYSNRQKVHWLRHQVAALLDLQDVEDATIAHARERHARGTSASAPER